MRSLTAALVAAVTMAVNAQNLVQNPGFETGAIPTGENQVALATGWNNNCGRNYASNIPSGLPGSPDLFDTRSTNCLYGIPSNKWGIRPTRAGGYRYVGFSGASTANGPAYYGETVEGALAGPLGASTYEVSFWASAVDGIKYQCNQQITGVPPDPQNKIEVVLRKGNNCSTGKSIFVSGSITSGNWQYFSGKFTLSAADAGAGYDRLELRLTQVAPSSGKTFHIVYLDDVSLVNKAPVTVCTCPAGSIANTTNQPGVTADGKCKKHVCGPITGKPLPPDGTPIGTWGFTWGDGIWQWIKPTCVTSGSASPTEAGTEPSTR